MTAGVCEVYDLGRIGYRDAERLQLRLVELRRGGHAPDRLVICEHDPVVTVGAAADDPEVESAAARAAGIEVHRVSRGGRATLHCPGQVVAYPILNLRMHCPDLHWYLRALEDTVIDALGELGCDAERVEGQTGVWCRGRKVASIGIAVRGWVTYHGLAVNVECDPTLWRLINPCGLEPEQMASLTELLPHSLTRDEVVNALVTAFGQRFGLHLIRRPRTELLAPSVF